MNIIDLFILTADAHAGESDSYFGHMMSDWMGMGWGMGGFFMIFFWVLVIVGIIYLIKYISQDQKGKQDKTPLDILKERYAKGEISKAEFDKKKKDLR